MWFCTIWDLMWILHYLTPDVVLHYLTLAVVLHCLTLDVVLHYLTLDVVLHYLALIWFYTIWHLDVVLHYLALHKQTCQILVQTCQTWPRPWCRKMAIAADSLVGSSWHLVCIQFIYPSIWSNFHLDFKCLQFLSKMFKVDWVIIGDFSYSVDCNVTVTYHYPNQFSLSWIVLWNVLSLVKVLSCEFPETPSKIQQLVTHQKVQWNAPGSIAILI